MIATIATPPTDDQAAFTARAERHRRELQVHLYRMTGSFEDAEDLVQETFLRAWRKRDTYAGRASLRAWLYKIATNAALDALAARPRRAQAVPGEEVSWLQGYPDHLLDVAAPAEAGPEAVVVERETIALTYLLALQHLPPRQRAVLLVRDVLGWSAAEAAELLELSVPAANSALQRARETLKQRLPRDRHEWAVAAPSADEQAVLRRFCEAHEQARPGDVAEILAADVKFWMPPEPETVVGRERLVALIADEVFPMGDWRFVPTGANRMPASACYVRRPGSDRFELLTLDVLRVVDAEVAEITTFHGPLLESAFGLPATA